MGADELQIDSNLPPKRNGYMEVNYAQSALAWKHGGDDSSAWTMMQFCTNCSFMVVELASKKKRVEFIASQLLHQACV